MKGIWLQIINWLKIAPVIKYEQILECNSWSYTILQQKIQTIKFVEKCITLTIFLYLPCFVLLMDTFPPLLYEYGYRKATDFK